MHADHAARVPARGTCFGTEARRESGEAQRQFGFAEDFVGDVIR
jgi:hypothetical protein